MARHWALVLPIVVGANSIAEGQDAPNVGIVYNTKEVSSITYRCTANGATLDCEFNQSSVRLKAQPSDLQARIDEAQKQFRQQGFSASRQECNAYKEGVAMLEGKGQPPDEAKFRDMAPVARRDALTLMNALSALCADRSEVNAVKVVKQMHDRDSRTCRVSSNAFKQSFKLVQDYSGHGREWVVQSQPEGTCGIVQLTRFEKDGSEDSKLGLWKYMAKKAITNPTGKWLPGVQCKELDQSEHVFDWRAKEHSLSCDYIELSAF
jgi:hypothetical protein